jgi:hypothetical protein
MSNNQGLISTIFDISYLMPSILQTIDASGSVPFSIDDLINSQEMIITKENTDRTSALAFVNTSIDSIKPHLYKWASLNFPGLYCVSTLTLNPPSVCADGVARSLVDYYLYLINMTIAEWLASMDAKTSGMHFTFSHDGTSNINLHITRG